MDDEQLKRWNEERVKLFAGARIPPHTLAAILHDARRLDFETAMRALPIYRAAKPYRGFYAVDWARHYEQCRAITAAGRTDRAQERAPAARWQDEEDERHSVEADKRREIAEYERIPAAARERARTALASLGWPTRDDSRAWRMIVIKWHRGEDVSSMLHPSRLCSALPEQRVSATLTREERARELRAMMLSIQVQLRQLEEAA
jgi:hypothetical protein